MHFDSLQAEDPKFYYSLSMGAMYISIFISVITCARYMDKTRNLRRIALTTITFSIVGNLTYTITFSPYLPIFGRFLCGINDGVRICAAGKQKVLKYSSCQNPNRSGFCSESLKQEQFRTLHEKLGFPNSARCVNIIYFHIYQ